MIRPMSVWKRFGILELLQRTRLILGSALAAWSRDKVSLMAASLSYYTLISVTPLVIMFLTLASILSGPEDMESRVFAGFRLFTGEDFTGLLQGWIRQAGLDPTRWLATIAGMAIILFGASQVFTSLQRAMRELWGVPRPRLKRLRFLQVLKTRASAFLMVIGIGALWFTAMSAGTLLAAWDIWLGETVPRGLHLVQLWHSILTVGIYAGFAAIIYRYLAPVKVTWRDVRTGSIVFSLLSVLGQKLLSYYLTYTTISTLYGAAGSLVVILLWFYYSWLIFFLGVEITKAVREYDGGPAPTTAEDSVE